MVFVLLFIEIFTIIASRTAVYGGIFRLWIGSVPDVRLSKAEYVEQILNNSTHLKKSLIYDFIRPWLGNGLLMSDGMYVILYSQPHSTVVLLKG
jgi:cytochrome P450 family 4